MNAQRIQECIPVGCVPPTCCPYLPACTAPGGVPGSRGVSVPGEVPGVRGGGLSAPRGAGPRGVLRQWGLLRDWWYPSMH